MQNQVVSPAPAGNKSPDSAPLVVTVGTSAPNADRIDISKLLIGYTAYADGRARYINSVAMIDAGDVFRNDFSVTNSGGNTIISVDRNGVGGAFAPAKIVTLNNATADLETLLANHQIVV